jgi:putative transposase
METTITTKLKLLATPEQFRQLRLTQLAYRDALNQASQYAFAHGKTSNSQRVHHVLYDEVRATHGLPSQMAGSVFRQVAATYKGLWTKWYKNVEARKAGWTRKRFKGLDKPPHYVSPTVTYAHGRDCTFKAAGQVSINTLSGRLVLSYQGWHRHVTWLQEGAIIGGAKLWYDRARHRFYLLVSLTIETSDPTPADLSQVVGIDLGQRYLATLTTPGNQTQFYSGKQGRATVDHYARIQKRLRRKGTRSATRRRLALSQADETVEAEPQSDDRQTDPGHPSQELSWPGRLDRHPRPDQTEAWQEGKQETAESQPVRLEMGVCGTARAADLQSGAGW